MLVQLDREWDRLRRRPATIRRVRGWDGDAAFLRTVARVRCLDELVGATQPHVGAPGSGDAVLRRLVELAATDELAGRIVLQRLLPGLISGSRRWTERGTNTDPSDIAVGAAWMAIRDFDVDVRSRHVAPALIADALWIGFRRGARRRVTSEVPVPDSVLGTQPAPPRVVEPMTALAGTLPRCGASRRATERPGVPPDDRRLRWADQGGSGVRGDGPHDPQPPRSCRRACSAGARPRLGRLVRSARRRLRPLRLSRA